MNAHRSFFFSFFFGGILIFVLQPGGCFFPVSVEQVQQAGGIVLPSLTGGAGIVVCSMVSVEEKNLSPAFFQCQICMKMVDEIFPVVHVVQ